MNTNDLLLRWSTLTLDQIEDEIRAGKDLDSATEVLGAQAVAEVQAVSFAPPSFGAKEPVVLLPGIMGSLLSSIRGVTSLIWINPLMFVQGNARYLRLNDDASEDGCSEVDIVPTGLEKMTYLQMEMKLNREAELYDFPYDWRRPIEYNADVLHNSLERWAGGSDRKFTLVAHSMGGLVSRTYMARHPEAAEKRVKQLIMLGTPNFGATNAIETLFTGNDLMGTVDKLNKQNGMIDVVRSLPGVYNLLPAPPESYPSGKAYAADWDLYNASAWGVPGIQQGLLDRTRQFYNGLAKSDPQVPFVQIAGCNMDTLITVKHPAAGIMQALQGNRVTDGPDSGDGTVPLWSSLIPRAKWYYVQEKHSNMPNNRQIIQATLDLLHGDTVSLPDQLPEPRQFFGVSFSTPPADSAGELESKIRSGTANQDDLRQLYFAL
jgi:pimeloyl-ACP methyl ester carboxylesterase